MQSPRKEEDVLSTWCGRDPEPSRRCTCVARRVSATAAFDAAQKEMYNPSWQYIWLVDMGDCTVFEWSRKDGLVFPSLQDIEQEKI